MFHKFNLAILISGGGSNMEAILRYFSQNKLSNLDIKAVISDREDASGLKKAVNYKVESRYLPPGEYKTKLVGKVEEIYINFLKKRGINLVCLAGFMRVLKRKFINAFPKQILNIHPSLLPKYKGLNTHKRVLENQERETGCTVHLVDDGIDTGAIIEQKKVAVASDDTPESLNKKVIQAEHILYSKVIKDVVTGKVDLQTWTAKHWEQKSTGTLPPS